MGCAVAGWPSSGTILEKDLFVACFDLRKSLKMRLFRGGVLRAGWVSHPSGVCCRGLAIKRHRRGSRSVLPVVTSVSAEMEAALKKHPINEELLKTMKRDENVMLVNETGDIVEKSMPAIQALQKARELELDLMLVASRPVTKEDEGVFVSFVWFFLKKRGKKKKKKNEFVCLILFVL